MSLTYTHESFSPWRLMDNTSTDEVSNKFNYSISAIAGMFGLLICTLMPLPIQEKEQKISEWIRRKRDEEEDDCHGCWIKKDGIFVRLRGINSKGQSVRDTLQQLVVNQ